MKRALSDGDLRQLLQPGETIVAQGRGSIPPPRQRLDRLTALTLAPNFFIAELLRPRLIRATGSDEPDSALFPLDMYMYLVVTTARILTWSLNSRPGDPTSLLAAVPLSQIDSVKTADLLRRSKKDLQVTMRDGSSVLIRVDTSLAGALKRQLRRLRS